MKLSMIKLIYKKISITRISKHSMDPYDDSEISDNEKPKYPYESDDDDSDNEYIPSNHPLKLGVSETEDYENDDEEFDEPIDSDEEDEEPDDLRFRKISQNMKQNILQEHHTELQFRSSEEVQQMSKIIRNLQGRIIDPLHRTVPILSKYEKARVLGERARQLEEGAEPFVPIPTEVIDSYIIAEMELKAKAIPFIIERPLPNGGCEYWQLADLEML